MAAIDTALSYACSAKRFIALLYCWVLPCRYLQDSVSASAASTKGAQKGPLDVTQCRKDPYRTKNLMPGLFVMHCPCCTRCLGFHVMQTAESPQALFEVLYTRWYGHVALSDDE